MLFMYSFSFIHGFRGTKCSYSIYVCIVAFGFISYHQIKNRKKSFRLLLPSTRKWNEQNTMDNSFFLSSNNCRCFISGKKKKKKNVAKATFHWQQGFRRQNWTRSGRFGFLIPGARERKINCGFPVLRNS
jgi:hypothetical protein